MCCVHSLADRSPLTARMSVSRLMGSAAADKKSMGPRSGQPPIHFFQLEADVIFICTILNGFPSGSVKAATMDHGFS